MVCSYKNRDSMLHSYDNSPGKEILKDYTSKLLDENKIDDFY